MSRRHPDLSHRPGRRGRMGLSGRPRPPCPPCLRCCLRRHTGPLARDSVEAALVRHGASRPLRLDFGLPALYEDDRQRTQVPDRPLECRRTGGITADRKASRCDRQRSDRREGSSHSNGKPQRCRRKHTHIAYRISQIANRKSGAHESESLMRPAANESSLRADPRPAAADGRHLTGSVAEGGDLKQPALSS